MINLIYENENVFVYKIKDWEVLRKEHRIVGDIFGHTQYTPVLPLRLLIEEALLLIDLGIAKLISLKDHKIHDNLKQFTEDLIKEENIVYRELRKEQLKIYGDHIVQAKRKHGDTRNRELILEEELNKINITEENFVWPLFLESLSPEETVEVTRETLLKRTSLVKLKAFSSLWQRNFYITSGSKFGGDFLVYNGDPLANHAVYIVRCLEQDEQLHPTELIALGRLANSVKKKGVLASLQNGETKFITISWIEQ